MTVAFDTLKFVRKLTQAGLPEAQAEVFANVHGDAFKEALDSNLATKADIATLKESVSSQIAELKESTTTQIAELRSEMVEFKESIRGEFAEFKESTNSQITDLRSEMLEFKETIRSEFAEFKESIMAEINQLKRRDDHLQAQISHLKWIMIFNLGFTVTIMWKVFS